MTEDRVGQLKRYGAAVLFAGLALALRGLLGPVFGTKSPMSPLVPGFLLSAAYGGTGAGVLTTVITAVLGTVLYGTPEAPAAYRDGAEQVRIFVFLASGLLGSWLIGSRSKALAEQRRAHALLEEREADLVRAVAAADGEQARLRALIASLPIPLVVTDATGRIVLSNEAVEGLLGTLPTSRSTQAWLGRVDAWVDPIGVPLRPADWAVARALGGSTATTDPPVRLRRPDGHVRTILQQAAPLRDPTGRAVGAVATFEDLSEFCRMRDDLRERVDSLEESLRERAEDAVALAEVAREDDAALARALADAGTTVRLPLGAPLDRVLDRLAREGALGDLKLDAPEELPAVDAEPALLEALLARALGIAAARVRGAPGARLRLSVVGEGGRCTLRIAARGAGTTAGPSPSTAALLDRAAERLGGAVRVRHGDGSLEIELDLDADEAYRGDSLPPA